ncbi:MAG: phosphate ABC transporter substrate-binding protein [Gloeobacteraceae cyanobacterium ES-bin-144]|nr:phosphate ABC transporter substrate-binding protein [Verrucomicrobiales bacterium]
MKTISTLIASAALLTMANAQTLSIKGSDTLGAKLVPQLAEAFKAAGNKGVKFEIAAEGSSTAFPALANGTAQIGMSSRKIKEDERTFCRTKGVYVKEIALCHDMICVIVNKNSPLTKLSKDQVAKIFTGQIKDWSEIGGSPGPISIYTRNTSSGTYKDWQKLAMGGRDYPSSSQKMAGTEQIAQEVAKNKNGIGYVGLAYAKTSGVKALPIDGTEPVAANANKYIYARLCYLYASDKPTPEADSFIKFAMSPAGQAIVSKVGFIPN